MAAKRKNTSESKEEKEDGKEKGSVEKKIKVESGTTIGDLLDFLKKFPKDTIVPAIDLSACRYDRGLLANDGSVERIRSFVRPYDCIPGSGPDATALTRTLLGASSVAESSSRLPVSVLTLASLPISLSSLSSSSSSQTLSSSLPSSSLPSSSLPSSSLPSSSLPSSSLPSLSSSQPFLPSPFLPSPSPSSLPSLSVESSLPSLSSSSLPSSLLSSSLASLSVESSLPSLSSSSVSSSAIDEKVISNVNRDVALEMAIKFFIDDPNLANFARMVAEKLAESKGEVMIDWWKKDSNSVAAITLCRYEIEDESGNVEIGLYKPGERIGKNTPKTYAWICSSILSRGQPYYIRKEMKYEDELYRYEKKEILYQSNFVPPINFEYKTIKQVPTSWCTVVYDPKKCLLAENLKTGEMKRLVRVRCVALSLKHLDMVLAVL